MVLAEPEIVGETVEELGIFKNDGSVGSRSTGETRDPTINVRRGGDLNVSNRQSECSENLPNRHARANRLDTLGRPNAADFLVLETGENGGKERRRPDSVVVGEEDDVGRRVTDAMGHLQTFVGERNGENPNPRGIDGISEILERAEHPLFGDDDDFLGFANKPGVGSFLELFTSINRWDNDRDVF